MQQAFPHQPYFLHQAKPAGLVLLIHGFMGSPSQLSYLAEAAHNQGYDVSALLLKGHGAGLRDFAAATKESWLRQIYDTMKEYIRSYDRIYLVGHSLGGALALNAAAKYGGQIDGLFLIACPLALRGFSLQGAKTWLQLAFYQREQPLKAAYFQGSAVPLNPGLLWRIPKPAAEGRKLLAMTPAVLPQIHTPLTAVYSQADELVDMRSLTMLQQGLPEELREGITLEYSRHAYYPPPEQDIIRRALLRLLDNRARH